MKIFRCVNFVVVILLVCLLISCKHGKTRADRKDVLEVAIMVSPVTFDPRIAADAESNKICKLIFDGLMEFNESMEVVPSLAERYEVISDTSYRFYLKKGVRFHSGAMFTAKDVKYTYESILDGQIISPFKESFSRIDKIKAEDDYTIRIDLKEPYSPFLTLMTRGIVSSVDAQKMGEDYGTHPIGTGPYKFVNFKPEMLVELSANQNYFGDKPRIPVLRLNVIKEDNIRILKIIKGDIDLAQNSVPPLLLDKVIKKGDLKMISNNGIIMTYMGLNLTDPKLKDIRVRKAIAYAINRDEIISHRFNGLATKANSLLPVSNWAYDTTLGQYDYDPVKAAGLLDEAGYKIQKDGKRFSLSEKTSVSKERIDIAKMLAYQLSKEGISVLVQPYEWGTFYRDVKTGNFQLYTLSWVGITEPDFFYDVSHSSQFPPQGVNRDKYENHEVDKLVEEGRQVMDINKRKEIYDKVQKIIFDDLPFIPLWYEKNVLVYKKDLKGVTLLENASYRNLAKIYR